MATNQQKVAYNTAIQVVGRLITAFLGIFTVGLTTRYLGLDGYGQLTTAVIFTSLFFTIGEAGTSNITVRELVQSKRRASDVIGNILMLRLLLSIAGSVICVIIGHLLYASPENAAIRQAIDYLAITLVLTTIQSAVTAPLVAKLRNGLLVFGSLLGKIVTLGLIIVCVRNNLGFTAIILATLAGSVANFISDLAFGLTKTMPTLRPDLKYWRYILAISAPIAAASVLNTIYFRADGLMLSLFKGNEAVALYGLSYKMVELTMTFPVFFMGAVFPLMAASSDKKRVAELTERALSILQIVSAAVVVGVIVMSSEAARLLGGAEFTNAALPMSILIVSNYFVYANSAYSGALIALNFQQKLLRVVLIALIANIGFNLIAIPLAGTAGAAAGVVVAELIGLWLLKRYYSRYVATPLPFSKSLPSLASALTMGVAVLWLKHALAPLQNPTLTLVAGVATGILVYSGLILFTGQFSLEKLKQLGKSG